MVYPTIQAGEKSVINSKLFEAFCVCPTKCFLRFAHLQAPENPVATWFERRNELYREEVTRKLLGERGVYSGGLHRAENIETSVDLLEQPIQRRLGRSFRHPVPIRLLAANKLSRLDRLLVGFDGLVLSKHLSRRIDVAKIIYGEQQSTVIVHLRALTTEVARQVARIDRLLSSASEPLLLLNRHCVECEFLN